MHAPSIFADIFEANLAGRITDAEARNRMYIALESKDLLTSTMLPGEELVPEKLREIVAEQPLRDRLQTILDMHIKIMVFTKQKPPETTPDSLWRYPAWELIDPRRLRAIAGELVPFPDENWPSRWTYAGGILRGDAGDRMVALKGDAIWGRLGDSRLFPDAMDVDVPPFAWGSGMGWRAVPRAECVALGAIAADWKPEGFEAWRMNERLRMGIANIPPDIAEAARKALKARIAARGGKSGREIIREKAAAVAERYLNAK